jgi:hypothetical protein
MANILHEELETYYKNKQELLGKYNGKYVLIKGKEIIDAYDTQKDAIKVGLDKFGNTPFLVKKVEEIESVQNFTSRLIKLPN